MNYLIQLDEQQVSHFIKPIFDNLNLLNLNDDEYFNLFLNINISKYWDLLPENIKNNPNYLKKALLCNLITLKQFPNHLINKQNISYNEYLVILKNNITLLNYNLYQEDYESMFLILEHFPNCLKEDWKKNKDFLIFALKKTTNIYPILQILHKYNFYEEIQNDFDLSINILKSNVLFFTIMKEEFKSHSKVLSIILEFQNLDIAKDYFKYNNDLNIALKLLSLNANPNLLHSYYFEILQSNNQINNGFDYLSKYFNNKKILNTLSNLVKKSDIDKI